MISSLAWVPPGVASTTPTYADVPEEELEHLEARARAVVRRGRGRGDEDEEDEEEDEERGRGGRVGIERLGGGGGGRRGTRGFGRNGG